MSRSQDAHLDVCAGRGDAQRFAATSTRPQSCRRLPEGVIGRRTSATLRRAGKAHRSHRGGCSLCSAQTHSAKCSGGATNRPLVWVSLIFGAVLPEAAARPSQPGTGSARFPVGMCRLCQRLRSTTRAATAACVDASSIAQGGDVCPSPIIEASAEASRRELRPWGAGLCGRAKLAAGTVAAPAVNSSRFDGALDGAMTAQATNAHATASHRL